jgi:hypothetical protein
MTVFWFIIVGGAGVVGLLLAAVFRLKGWWSALVGLAVAIVVAVVFHLGQPVTLGREHWYDVSPVRELILFVLMLGGMAARVVSLAIERAQTGGGTPTPQMNKWDFVYPMLFAVPTFGALLSQVAADTLTTANVILSFETGFFWQTILKSAEPKLDAGRPGG